MKRLHAGYQCGHAWTWTKPQEQTCENCGAWCRRDDRGKIEDYDRKPGEDVEQQPN